LCGKSRRSSEKTPKFSPTRGNTAQIRGNFTEIAAAVRCIKRFKPVPFLPKMCDRLHMERNSHVIEGGLNPNVHVCCAYIKTVLVPNAQAGELVAKGEVEMGVAQASELAAVPGTQVVGPLPGDLNSEMIFSVGIGSQSKNPAAAKTLIELPSSPTGAAVLKSKGMDSP
jgi:Bacterial extracellular solute-binding protein